MVGYVPQRATNMEWNQHKRKRCVSDKKLNGVEDLKNILTSDIEIQCLEFAQLVLCLALVQYFLTMFLSL